MPGYWNAHSDLDWYFGNAAPSEAPQEVEPEPDDTYWESLLTEAEAQVTGPDPYRAGWAACMDWQEFDPPPSLSPDEAALWRDGWQDAYDAPLGSAAP